MAVHDELSLLRIHLGLALTSLGLAHYKIEDGLGIGHGTLNRLLDGRMELKLSHLVVLCKLLDIHPRDLIEAGFPDWEAKNRLNDWMPVKVRKEAAPPLTLSDDVVQAIRAVVREEISLAGLTPGNKPAKSRRRS
jgi:DNA-binding Xre family transcriptional regulator